MVNHPNRSQMSIETVLRRFIKRHSLIRVDLRFSDRGGVSALAVFNSFSPIYLARRDALLRTAGEMTMAQAGEIETKAKAPLSGGSRETLSGALDALDVELSRTEAG